MPSRRRGHPAVLAPVQTAMEAPLLEKSTLGAISISASSGSASLEAQLAALDISQAPRAEVQQPSGALVEEPDAKGITPLLAAIRGGHLILVMRLLQASANVKTADKRGFTPLIKAATRRPKLL